MFRIVLAVALFAFSAAPAQELPRGVKPPPPHDPSLGPDPKPRAKPMPPRRGEAADLVVPAPPPNAPPPDPKAAANPKSAALLWGIIAGMEKDSIDLALFGPDMLPSLKANGAALMAFVQAQGQLKALSYKGSIAPMNPIVMEGRPPPPLIEEYESVHEGGKLRWRFHLGPDGKVARMVTMLAAE